LIQPDGIPRKTLNYRRISPRCPILSQQRERPATGERLRCHSERS
jgi:hypothetical protein